MYRSLLYIPAINEKFVAKAHTRGADAIILDLEDSVPVTSKAEAREKLGMHVAAVGQGGATVFVRINSTPEHLIPDAVAACEAGAYGLYVPKVGSPETLDFLDQALSPLEARLGRKAMALVPLIEDPGAVFEARRIARSKRVIALSVGGEDIATVMGAIPTPEVLRLPKLLVHMAAKAEGRLSLGLIRSVAEFKDVDVIREAASEARAFGFDGASCIHPGVVSPLNEAFSPSPTEVERARRIVEANAQAIENKIGAFVLDDEFIDAPVVERAQRLLARL